LDVTLAEMDVFLGRGEAFMQRNKELVKYSSQGRGRSFWQKKRNKKF
jgi:hypothetical protein